MIDKPTKYYQVKFGTNTERPIIANRVSPEYYDWLREVFFEEFLPAHQAMYNRKPARPEFYEYMKTHYDETVNQKTFKNTGIENEVDFMTYMQWQHYKRNGGTALERNKELYDQILYFLPHVHSVTELKEILVAVGVFDPNKSILSLQANLNYLKRNGILRPNFKLGS